MGNRILVVGAGAVGSYLGGWLSHTGDDVTLLDPWAEHVEAIRKNGLSVKGPHEPFVAKPHAFHTHEAQRLAVQPPFDTVFVCVKSFDTHWAAQLGKPFLKPGGYMVSAQNCWNDPVIAATVGSQNAVGLIMSSIQVALWEPGKVERGGKKRRRDEGHDVFRAGEHDGRVSPRIKGLVEMLEPIDGARTTGNLWGERWSKLCANAMGNPVSAASGLGSGDIGGDRRGRELTVRLACETAKVGLMLGYAVPPFAGAPAEKWAASDRGDVYEELDGMLAATAGRGDWRPSMAQDVVKGRPTEINEMNGCVVRRAADAGVPVPVTTAMVATVRAIDAGTMKPARENIERTLVAAGF
jgi:2-dehydropantoate 2-reductase